MSSTRTNSKLISFNQLPSTIYLDPNENEHYENLYQVAKQIYKRYTKMLSQHRQLQNKYTLIKAHYIEVKTKLVQVQHQQHERQHQQQQQQEQGVHQQQQQQQQQVYTRKTRGSSSNSGSSRSSSSTSRSTCSQQ